MTEHRRNVRSVALAVARSHTGSGRPRAGLGGALAGAALADIEVGPEVRRIADEPCHSIPLSVRGVDGLRPVRVEVCAQPAAEAP